MRSFVLVVSLLALIGCGDRKEEKKSGKPPTSSSGSAEKNSSGEGANLSEVPLQDEDAKYTDYGPETEQTTGSQAALAEGQPLAKPTPRQLEFMDYELGMFIHFGLNTFTGQQHGDGKKPPSDFNPTKLDCDQWIRVAKSMGAKYVVFTARHEGGFCLWPTKTTDYSVKGSPWKNGKGDLVREYVDACHKHGLKVGLYHSSSFDAHHREVRRLNDQEFLKIQVAQMTELLTNYGPIEYMWFDHHKGDEFWQAIDNTVSSLQGNCLRFGPDVWLIGGHTGVAPSQLWYPVDTTGGTMHDRPTNASGLPHGRYFRVWEANTTGNGYWFWHGAERSVAAPLPILVEKYYRSVGRGANLLLNFAPDPRGLIPDDAVARAQEFGDEIRRRFATPIAETKGKGSVVTLDLGKPTIIDHVVVMEDLADGQKIAKHSIEVMLGGQWQPVASGRTVGHKRIYRARPVPAEKVRFRCLKSVQGPVVIRSLAVFRAGSDG